MVLRINESLIFGQKNPEVESMILSIFSLLFIEPKVSVKSFGNLENTGNTPNTLIKFSKGFKILKGLCSFP